jgi:hypothetical protein
MLLMVISWSCSTCACISLAKVEKVSMMLAAALTENPLKKDG